jgi:3-oxoacyl-[acyl-carrier protein] reductase
MEQTSAPHSGLPVQPEFLNRVAIVTGATGGIGQALVKAFVRAGACVVANFHSNQVRAETLRQEILALGGKILLSQGSVSHEDYVKSLVSDAISAFGRIDILVNNAGVLSRQFAMLTKLEAWRNAIDINLTGAFLCSREVLHAMVDQRSGSIVNITSVAAFGGLPGQVTYASSKAGMVGLTRTLAKEVARSNIRVNAIAPGYVETEMLSPKDAEAAQKLTPLGRAGKPEEIADIALFLASERSKYITGQTIIADGGLTL